MRPTGRIGLLLMLVTASAAPIPAQQYDLSHPAGGPFSKEPVPNAPFSADATTIIRETSQDGSVHEQTVTAHYYRDSQGRTRADVDTAWGPYVVVRLFFRDGEPVNWPTDRMASWVLEPARRGYRASPFADGLELFNGEGRVALPVGKACFQRMPPVLVGASDAERLQAVHAQVSPDLGIVIASHRADSVGTVDYRVTNIRRNEPSASLFEIPSDYTLVRGSSSDPLIGYSPWQSRHVCGPLTR